MHTRKSIFLRPFCCLPGTACIRSVLGTKQNSSNGPQRGKARRTRLLPHEKRAEDERRSSARNTTAASPLLTCRCGRIAQRAQKTRHTPADHDKARKGSNTPENYYFNFRSCTTTQATVDKTDRLDRQTDKTQRHTDSDKIDRQTTYLVFPPPPFWLISPLGAAVRKAGAAARAAVGGEEAAAEARAVEVTVAAVRLVLPLIVKRPLETRRKRGSQYNFYHHSQFSPIVWGGGEERIGRERSCVELFVLNTSYGM